MIIRTREFIMCIYSTYIFITPQITPMGVPCLNLNPNGVALEAEEAAEGAGMDPVEDPVASARFRELVAGRKSARRQRKVRKREARRQAAEAMWRRWGGDTEKRDREMRRVAAGDLEADGEASA